MTILCALPAYGNQVYVPFHRSYLAMARRCAAAGIGLPEIYFGNTFPSHARNVGVGCVLANQQFSHLLCLDADVGFPPEMLQRLISAKKPIVAGVYPRRYPGKIEFIVGFGAGEKSATVEDGFAKAKRVGAGMLLIRREVLEALAARYPELVYTDKEVAYPAFEFFPSGPNAARTAHMTDDTGFCELAMKAGFDIWADLHTPMTHTGPVTFEVGSYLDHCAPNP